MESGSKALPPLRVLLTEAAEYRRRGDLAAAAALEADALRAMRASIATERPGVAQ
jgi:hypothetical protein